MWILSLLACFGGARHEVDLADLAPLGAEQLGPLKDEEHALAVAVTMLEGARAEAERADQRVGEARDLRRQAELEHETAQAALDAARASRDPLRIGSAEGIEESAKRDVKVARARLVWQEAALRVAEDAIDLADARIELRRAELELARYDLLDKAGRGIAYKRSDFVDQLDVAREIYEEAERSHEAYTKAATRAWEEWRQWDQYPASEPGYPHLEG